MADGVISKKNELMDQPIYLLFVLRTQCLKFTQKFSFSQYVLLFSIVFDDIFSSDLQTLCVTSKLPIDSHGNNDEN